MSYFTAALNKIYGFMSLKFKVVTLNQCTVYSI